MTLYNKKQYWKYALLLFALAISTFTLFYTDRIVQQLEKEERKKIELWAEATQKLVEAESSLEFPLLVIQDNTSIPVILADEKDNIVSYRNFDSARIERDSLYLKKELTEIKKIRKPIKIQLYDKNYNYIYYKDSLLLTQLTYFPYVQLAVFMIFILVAYLAFSSARRSEQNQVWVGLSKETAHQLGTPTSSLLACVEILKEKQSDQELTLEVEKDVKRLEVITSRFSNIGSKPVLKDANLKDVINSIVDYLQSRVSGKIKFHTELPEEDVFVKLNNSLFEWVLENICKNAVDAISDSGSITLSLKPNSRKVYLDIADTGKGIQRSKFNTIFKPGFTTKSRGWGLGLSLAKRIVEEYHHGKIYVLSSELNKGTVIRIELKK